MSTRAAIRLAVIAASLIALSSCNGPRAPILQQAFGYNCNVHDSPDAKRLCQKNDAGPAQVSRYCYHTLADANCFDRPDPNSKNQALGSSGY